MASQVSFNDRANHALNQGEYVSYHRAMNQADHHNDRHHTAQVYVLSIRLETSGSVMRFLMTNRSVGAYWSSITRPTVQDKLYNLISKRTSNLPQLTSAVGSGDRTGLPLRQQVCWTPSRSASSPGSSVVRASSSTQVRLSST